MSQRADFRLYTRQKQLLALLYVLGGSACNLDFQKLLFLYCQEASAAAQEAIVRRAATRGARSRKMQTVPYEFVPYRCGAFSYSSYADRRRLVERGLLVDDDQYWSLTPVSSTVARACQDERLHAFAVRYHDLRGDVLVAETYCRYPYFANRSRLVDRVCKGDATACGRTHDAQPQQGTAALITIGYEKRTLEGYLNLLIQAGVDILCDVRRNALSRRYGFSKQTLAGACAEMDIRYEHVPELGIETRRRQGLQSPADYQALFRTYAQSTLPRQGGALGRICAWLQNGACVALTCYERNAIQCHRHCVAAAIAEITAQNVQSAGSQAQAQAYDVRHL